MTPESIGHYRIEAELGRGAAGTAFQARDPETGQVVAIKLLSEQMTRDETMQRRFVREMSLLSKLKDKNIVRYFDGGIHDGRFFYAMELVDSGTLKDVLSTRSQIPWPDAVECAAQVASALEHAHEAGIIHRDLKPGNLFLSDNGLVKLGDFGLARDLEGSTLTTAGMTVGTCLYMSPEQIEGRRDITPAADLYALGCLLFETLTGRVPFRGDKPMDVLKQHHGAAPPELADFLPNAPPELGKLICRLMAKKPENRPPAPAKCGGNCSRSWSNSQSQRTRRPKTFPTWSRDYGPHRKSKRGSCPGNR